MGIEATWSLRAIPAGAGETRTIDLVVFLKRGNPRGRGGDVLGVASQVGVTGQSPRARGRPCTFLLSLFSARAIPAGAGETEGSIQTFTYLGGNPRGRGGDHSLGVSYLGIEGQSPRARGRQTEIIFVNIRMRAIPAGAGETESQALFRWRVWGNPRGRGGDFVFPLMNPAAGGQSPRARGRPPIDNSTDSPSRAIPAGAGETSESFFTHAVKRGNPRGRGGDTKIPRSPIYN